MTGPERMSLMGPPCTYSAEEHQRIGRMWTRGLSGPARTYEGGMQPGELNRNARLTEAAVIEIRRLCAEGMATPRDIAARFGVSPSHISGIRSRRTWKHVPEAVA